MAALRLFVLSFSLFTGFGFTAHAQTSCAQLGIGPDQLADGTTYYRSTSGWQQFTGFSQLPLQTFGIVHMAYVVGTKNDHTGVLVVKSGRVPRNPHVPDGQVKLVRNDARADGVCRVPSVFSDTVVPGYDYDQYHDFGRYRLPQQSLDAFKAFHIEYGTTCRRTDSAPLGFGRHVSDRASFSFTEDVVDNGGYAGWEKTVAAVGLGRATAAGSPAANFLERRTEIKQYATVNGTACIGFDLPISDQGYFVRINDLAAPFPNNRPREHRY